MASLPASHNGLPLKTTVDERLDTPGNERVAQLVEESPLFDDLYNEILHREQLTRDLIDSYQRVGEAANAIRIEAHRIQSETLSATGYMNGARVLIGCTSQGVHDWIRRTTDYTPDPKRQKIGKDSATKQHTKKVSTTKRKTKNTKPAENANAEAHA